jgi:hypothetical protein
MVSGDDHVGVVHQDLAAREHHGLQPGAAHLVDGDGARRHRQPGLDPALARRRLADARRQHVAHDDPLDLIGRGPGAPNRLAHRSGAEVRGGQGRKRALERPDGGPRGAGDDDLLLAHAFSWWMRGPGEGSDAMRMRVASRACARTPQATRSPPSESIRIDAPRSRIAQ